MKRYIKTLVSTDDLVEFVHKQKLHLGKTNIRRTINFYIQQGLLPRRIQTSDGKFHWGFPTYIKALLVRIARLRERGLSLREIKSEIEEEVEKGYPVFKRPHLTLSGMDEAFDDPVYDYAYDFIQTEVREALRCLRNGKTKDAERILRDLDAIIQPPAEGERHLIVVGLPKRTRAALQRPTKQGLIRLRKENKEAGEADG